MKALNKKAEAGMTALISIIMVVLLIGVAGVVLNFFGTSVGSTSSNEQSYSYVIFKDDFGRTCAKNGATGVIDWASSNSTAVIQNALLTSGLVVIKPGIYSINYEILLYNNTHLSMYGATLISSSSSASNILTTQYHTAAGPGNHDIFVEGGVLDGNFVSQNLAFSLGGGSVYLHENVRVWNLESKNSGVHGIYFLNCNNSEIRNVIVHDSLVNGIDVGASKNMLLTGSVSYYNGYYGYDMHNDLPDSNMTIFQCVSHENVKNATAIGLKLPGMVLSMYSVGNRVENCIFYDEPFNGIGVHGNNNLIFGNEVYNCGQDGIYLWGSHNTIQNNKAHNNMNNGIGSVGYMVNGTVLYGYSNFISGNQIYRNNWSGVSIYNTYGMMVSGNDIYDNAQGSNTSYAGIWLHGIAKNNTISGNLLNDSQSVHTQDRAIICTPPNATYNSINLNRILYGICYWASANYTNLFVNNDGYKTEAYGALYFTPGDQFKNSTHNLCNAPNAVFIAGNNSETLNATIYIANGAIVGVSLPVPATLYGVVYWYAKVM
jgi:parallel beta-helix repeat protein